MGMLAELKSNWTVVNGMLRTLKTVGKLEPDSQQLLPDDIEATVDRHTTNVFIRFEDQILTYGELDAYANKVAHWALEQGLTPGDCVALVMENRPEYVAIWYGLSKVGVVTALINNNLTDKALAHCINISDASRVIFGAQQDEAAGSLDDLLDGAPQLWTLGGATNETRHDFGAALERQSDARPSREYRASVRAQDLALYVYTSGTTGLPKAARLPHMRVQGMMRTFIAACRITPADRIYITLPLYHGTGGVCGIGLAVQTGASVILREKFSASRFWEDAVTYKATVFAYIGELCRYLLNTPESPAEKQHSIRTGFGNGLRPEIWQKFFDRFNIPHLAEFYGSTEGNVSFMNFDGKVGAVGKIPGFAARVYAHVKFVKFDVETEKPLRGDDGFCIECEPGEVGEVIGR
ncbi:MAG: AMP-binding protein, partial [Hyphomonadaceae bacterium]|nr:AMP-binding protein [Hyphomonadaceae bacterium]